MANNVHITSGGIQKVLRNYNEKQAVAEYIWNGFDAKANQINIDYSANSLGFIDSLSITDNGYGINFKQLKPKFDHFYESEKALQLAVHKNRSALHGKNGVGRLTFFKFAGQAEWETTFMLANKLKSGTIRIDGSNLNNYQAVPVEVPLHPQTGTIVRFTNLKISEALLEKEIIPFLKAEFCWFLELNKKKKFVISINGKKLDYEDQVAERAEDIIYTFDESRTLFRVKFIQWKENLHRELSKVYYISEKGEELYKDYTSLNKKADDYFHSVYIQSEFFTDFDFSNLEVETQFKLYNRSKSSAEYRYLSKEIHNLLVAKRKIFLKENSGKLIDRYENEGVIKPQEGKASGAKQRKLLHDTLKAMYEARPKLFSNLSLDQKKTVVSLVDVLLQSNQKNKIRTIMENITELETEERAEFDALLNSKA